MARRRAEDADAARVTDFTLMYSCLVRGRYDFTESHDDQLFDGLRLATRRDDHDAGAQGKKGTRQSEIVYSL